MLGHDSSKKQLKNTMPNLDVDVPTNTHDRFYSLVDSERINNDQPI